MDNLSARDIEDPWTLLSLSPWCSQKVSSEFREKPCLKKGGEQLRMTSESICGLHTYQLSAHHPPPSKNCY